MSELIDYGLRIERGEIEDAGFHLTLYTAPPDADPWKQSTWKLANPAVGRLPLTGRRETSRKAGAANAKRGSELQKFKF